MSNGDKRFWFLAHSKADSLSVYVISAGSVGDAMDAMGMIKENYEYQQLTNGELAELLGAEILNHHNPEEPAQGDIVLPHKQGYVSIRVAD